MRSTRSAQLSRPTRRSGSNGPGGARVRPPTASEDVPVIVDVVVLASIYALLALGYVIVYRTSRVLNFAHGDMFMVAGYLAFAFVSALSLPPMLALPAALLGGAVAGLLIY